jgi:hypothetical protein
VAAHGLTAFSRRHVLNLASGAGAFAASLAAARAQTPYPSRPVHVLLGFAAGGASDVIGRLMSQWLSEKLGQPFVFDNRPGAASNIATELVAKEAPDGYSLLWCTSANANNATLYQNLNFNFIRDFAPIAARFACPTCWKYIHQFRSPPFRNSSPTLKPIPASSTLPRAASAPRSTWPPSFSCS